MDLGIAGRRAIVCASSRGLGRGCAQKLAEAGCVVVMNGRDQAVLETSAEEVRVQTGAEIIAVAGDVTDADVRAQLITACGAVDILVNNAGGPPLADFRELSAEAMHAGVTSNMITPIKFVQDVIDGMVERKFGRIINITSASVLMGIQGLDLSSGARAGLTAFLSGVARQFAHANVTINGLLPGNFDTDRQAAIIQNIANASGQSEADVRKAREASGPAKRLGTPQEFGAACAFLASSHAGFINGQNLLMDGGTFTANFP